MSLLNQRCKSWSIYWPRKRGKIMKNGTLKRLNSLDVNATNLDELRQGPTELRIEVTRKCPLECLHCSACSNSGNDLQLKTEQIIAAVTDFRSMGGDRVIITGGEPLVHPELMSVLESLNDIGIRPILFTSGITGKSEYCRSLDEVEIKRLRPLLSSIVFSLYGKSASVHEYITQRQYSFAMTLHAIQKAIRLGIPTDIHFVPMKVNYQDLAGIANIARSIGIEKVRVLRFVPHGRAEEYASELLPSEEDYVKFAMITRMARERYPDLLQIGAAFRGIVPDITKTCSAAYDKLVVTADGSVAPCDGFKNLQDSNDNWNINVKSLSEIYASSPLFTSIRAIKTDLARHGQSCCYCMAQKAVSQASISCDILSSTTPVFTQARS